MLKKLFLLLWSCILAVISFTMLGGMYFWDSNREFALFWLMITIVIFLIYITSVFILRKRFSGVFLLLNILLFIVIVINGPQLQLLSSQIQHYLKIPSKELQTQMNLEVSNAIKEMGIPYKVDLEVSKGMTKERSEAVVVLVKTKKEEVNKPEVDRILSVTFSNELFLSFYDYSKSRIISIYFNENGEVEYCYPSVQCKEFQVQVKSEQ